MYLPQAVSHQPSIGAASDLFWHTGAAWEMRLEPAEATCSLVVPPSLLLTRCRGRYTGARSDLSKVGSVHTALSYQSELGQECRNPADLKVCAYA